MYVYRKTNADLSLIPKGLYVKMLKMTYNPFGIKKNGFEYAYKHTFPSGICDRLEMRHKTDNSVLLFLNLKRTKMPFILRGPF
jgi:hypothetical protein